MPFVAQKKFHVIAKNASSDISELLNCIVGNVCNRFGQLLFSTYTVVVLKTCGTLIC